MVVEPKKVLFTKDAVISRGLLPSEKDAYTFHWFGSLWNSTLSLGGMGVSAMAMSIVGHKLFLSLTELASVAYLEVSAKTLSTELLAAKAIFYIGGGLLAKSVINAFNEK